MVNRSEQTEQNNLQVTLTPPAAQNNTRKLSKNIANVLQRPLGHGSTDRLTVISTNTIRRTAPIATIPGRTPAKVLQENHNKPPNYPPKSYVVMKIECFTRRLRLLAFSPCLPECRLHSAIHSSYFSIPDS